MVMETQEYVDQLVKNAKLASRTLRALSAETRNSVLKRAASLLRTQIPQILEANKIDVDAAITNGLTKAMIDRLTLNERRIEDMATALDEIADFADPLGKVLETRVMANGADLSRVTTPIGTVLFIYESRPNVTIDGAGLCFKSGNAVILRGGKESAASSQILANIFRQSLLEAKLPVDAVQLISTPDRQVVTYLLQRNDALDLVIPRGGESLIRAVVEQSRVPVIKHYKGVCHIYVDSTADQTKVSEILVNAKVQRPSACNALETLLIDQTVAPTLVVSWLNDLVAKGVKIFACPRTKTLFSQAELIDNESQYFTEYLDLQISVRIVDSLEQAVEHIETYGSSHTESILSSNSQAQSYFLANIGSSSVMVNASTRLADGGVYGLGAEVGISTDKLHARGPMGVDSLTTYKWIVIGSGQIRK